MNKFISILETIGKDCLKTLEVTLKYAVPVEQLVALIFPSTSPALPEVISATTLIQNAVIVIEQKYAAGNQAGKTGTQKLADVLSLTGATVTSLLAKAGITADPGYVSRIVNAVVAILNVQSLTTVSV